MLSSSYVTSFSISLSLMITFFNKHTHTHKVRHKEKQAYNKTHKYREIVSVTDRHLPIFLPSDNCPKTSCCLSISFNKSWRSCSLLKAESFIRSLSHFSFSRRSRSSFFNHSILLCQGQRSDLGKQII